MGTRGGHSNNPGNANIGHAGLTEMLNQDSVEILEAGVKISSRLLDSLGKSLQGPHNSAAVARLIDSIADMRRHAETKRTVVGVVGNTGSGKSSIINAVVDEERIIPTNCVRACTAVVTELSYNNSDDPAQAYRAEIEFITKEEWMAELNLLFGDLSDSSDNSAQGSTRADPAAVVAKAKLMAVYPHLAKSKNIPTSSTPATLADDPHVLNYLNTTKKVSDQSPHLFYEKLQKYVDSKEKTRDKKSNKSPVMELWPLIKTVRVYVKSDALSTGLVLVDLPGIHDSNAARSGVAGKYMKECTYLWVVAPISRAVDDKTAQTLLGDSFKRQLQMDGSYNNVTFICSKTDDISITEAIDNLILSSEMEQALIRKDELQKQLASMTDECNPLQEEFDDARFALSKLDTVIDELEDKISNRGPDGRVLARVTTPMKRKRAKKFIKNQKRARVSSNNQEDQDNNGGFSSSDDDDDDDDEPQTSLTLDDATKQLEQFKSEKRMLKNKKKTLKHVLSPMKAEIGEIKTQISDIEALQATVMIRQRNDYAKPCIKYQFAQGIRQIDEELAAAADPENFDPDEDYRDYDDVAASLPVFCVSSRAFHKLKGRLEKDGAVRGFQDEDDTEIPQLVTHAKNLTIEARVKSSKNFLNEVKGLVNSLTMWITVGMDSLQLSGTEKKKEATEVEALLAHLREELVAAVDRLDSVSRNSMKTRIVRHFPYAETRARINAAATASGWTQPKDQGGMLWMTFKATCRRSGVYSGAAGPRDFNEDLIKPLKTSIAADWEKAFTKTCPKAIKRYKADVAALLKAFHLDVAAREGIKTGSSPIGLDLVEEQMVTYSQSIDNDATDLWNSILSDQKDANRELTPIIMGAMGGIYLQTTNEQGTGCFKRSKDAMLLHVNNTQGTMFGTALSMCEQNLSKMCDSLRDKMRLKIDTVFSSIKEDYMNLIVGAGSTQAGQLTKENLPSILASANQEYERALSSRPPVVKMEGVELA